MYTCENCGKEFEEEKQLRGHRMTCRSDNEKISEEAVRERRKERVPFGTPEDKLLLSKRPGFARRVFNDNWVKEPGRIQRAEQAGWNTIEDHPINGMAVGTNKDGSEIRGVAMEIPEEFYLEDQALKRKRHEEIMDRIYQGTYQEKAGDKRYVPSVGIDINVTQGD